MARPERAPTWIRWAFEVTTARKPEPRGRKARNLQNLMLRSRSKTLVSVKRVTQQSSGRKTTDNHGERASRRRREGCWRLRSIDRRCPGRPGRSPDWLRHGFSGPGTWRRDTHQRQFFRRPPRSTDVVSRGKVGPVGVSVMVSPAVGCCQQLAVIAGPRCLLQVRLDHLLHQFLELHRGRQSSAARAMLESAHSVSTSAGRTSDGSITTWSSQLRSTASKAICTASRTECMTPVPIT